jgi:hypothetical protein
VRKHKKNQQFGLVLASLWGESLGTLKRLAADLNSDLKTKNQQVVGLGQHVKAAQNDEE